MQPPPHRVLMTADAVGGVWTYALALAGALADRAAVTLAVMGPEPSVDQWGEASRIANLEVRHCPCKLEWMDDPWEEVDQAGQWLLEIEQAVSPDIVHLNNYVHGALPWRTPVLIVGHSCVVSWWNAVHGEEPPAQWAAYQARVHAGLAAADVVAAPTAAMLAALSLHYGAPRRTRVIPNGLPRAVSGTTAKEPFVLCAGRLWDQAKNVEAICACAPLVRWPVVIAGDLGQSHAAAAPIASGITTLGRLSSRDLAAWMQRAAIYALPARYEPFGLSILEAAQAGCALVLGDIRSLREVWGDAACYVPPDNRRALAITLNRLMEDEALRQEMSGRAITRSTALSADRMAQQYDDEYGRLR